MIFRTIIPFISFSIGIILMFIFLGSFSKAIPEGFISNDSINLALRQTGDKLYTIAHNETSQIPAVIQLSDTKYALKLVHKIDYDTLPFILNQSFSDYGITDNYEVKIKDCITEDIILGFNILALKNNDVPCQGRERSSTCSIIELTFIKTKTNPYINLSISLFFFIIGSMSLYFKSNNKLNENSKNDNRDEESIGVLPLANSIFTPNKLTININGTSKTLTFRESKLLKYFFKNPNIILKREEIQNHVWGDEGVIVGRSVDVFISRLRKILKEDQSLQIKNIHGIGYRLEVTSPKTTSN